MSDVLGTPPKDSSPKFGGWLVALLLLSLPIALYGLSFPWTDANPSFQARLDVTTRNPEAPNIQAQHLA